MFSYVKIYVYETIVIRFYSTSFIIALLTMDNHYIIFTKTDIDPNNLGLYYKTVSAAETYITCSPLNINKHAVWGTLNYV